MQNIPSIYFICESNEYSINGIFKFKHFFLFVFEHKYQLFQCNNFVFDSQAEKIFSRYLYFEISIKIIKYFYSQMNIILVIYF